MGPGAFEVGLLVGGGRHTIVVVIGDSGDRSDIFRRRVGNEIMVFVPGLHWGPEAPCLPPRQHQGETR